MAGVSTDFDANKAREIACNYEVEYALMKIEEFAKRGDFEADISSISRKHPKTGRTISLSLNAQNFLREKKQFRFVTYCSGSCDYGCTCTGVSHIAWS
jgi:hypothetical protein